MNHSLSILSNYLESNAFSVSVGGLGALAEYEGSSIKVNIRDSALTLQSKSILGAFKASIPENVKIFAQESLSSNRRLWNQDLVIAESPIPSQQSHQGILQELGIDENCLAPKDKGSLLFDLGTGLANCKFCIRTKDKSLITELRQYINQNILVDLHPAMESIIEASPTRVVISKIARIEVYQKISRDKTPTGPHTHLLPDLLSSKLTHSNKLALPPDCMPILNFHPKRISRHDPQGYASCEHFDVLLNKFGDPKYFATKTKITRALKENTPPFSSHDSRTSLENNALRIALLQSKHYFPSRKLAANYLSELD